MECQLGRALRERLGHLRSVEIGSNANNRLRNEGRKEGRSSNLQQLQLYISSCEKRSQKLENGSKY
jgi:hypothetical protein